MIHELFCCVTDLLLCCLCFDDYKTYNNTNNINNRDKQFVNSSNNDITIVEDVPLLKNRRSNNIERK